MNIYSHSNIKSLYVFGDIHGEFKQLFHKIKTHAVKQIKNNENEKLVDDITLEQLQIHLEDMSSIVSSKFYNYSYDIAKYLGHIENCVIIVGDCGFGFNKEEYYHQLFNKYHELLKKNNIYVYFVRGNHDDPSYFTDNKINYEYIKTVSDYSVICVNDKNILCVGGGLSIDRIWRKQQEIKINKYKKTIEKKLYWENEMPIYSEDLLNEIQNNDIKINIVISHTSPHFVFPTKKDSLSYWAKLDKNLYKDIEIERNTLTSIFDFLTANKHPLTNWYYGHFHCNNTEKKQKVTFTAINELDISKVKINNESEESLKDFFDTLINTIDCSDENI